ncbi:hypothetical protein [Malacoplasma iowae]|uniref:Community-acquired respiratory distress syndrome toxin n=1 Tax=Malacoplasma iowae DK-CPA TaxID=1394179 RepID=A0A084U431_MALIO|nr:hypothetical protein [Malacoplasma iowae]KFB07717.1 community-acquired respiratory distress syndrome toxin [Malacoplasma iowae DK-CPA]WPL41006.1 hypothetical protein QX184_00150 [Malacoplasma iowae]
MIINSLELDRKDGNDNPRNPKYVYKIDKRDPNYVFQNGFTAWGSNDDFFAYVAGFINNYKLPEFFRSLLISVFPTIENACTNFISSVKTNYNAEKYYLYKIRADNEYYSTTKTMMHYLPTLVKNSGSKDETLKFADNVFRLFTHNFLWQNDWFKIGTISNESIISAREIIVTDLNWELMGRSTDVKENYKNMIIDDKEIFNVYYDIWNTTGNVKPWNPPEPNLKKYLESDYDDPDADELTVYYKKMEKPKPVLYLSRSYWNLNSMLSSVTPTPSLQQLELERDDLELPKISDYKEDLEGFNHCNVANVLYQVHNWELNDSDSRIRKDLDDIEFSDIIFTNKSFTRKYKVNFQVLDNGGSFIGLKLLSDSRSKVELSKSPTKQLTSSYYDAFSRISFSDYKYPVSVSFGPIINQFNLNSTRLRIGSLIQSVNDDFQKWNYQIYDEVKDSDGNTTRALIKLLPVHKKYQNLGLVVRKEKWNDTDDYPMYLLNLEDVASDDSYEEIFLLVSRNDTSLKMLQKQPSFDELVDLNLRYVIKGTSYSFDMYDKGSWSYFRWVYNQFFYDLRRKRIYWIDNKLNVFALYNNRNENDNWNWAEWKRIYSLDMDNDDPRYKWYFIYKEDIEDHEGVKESRWIRSYYHNDWLKVATGTHFGKLFTSKYDEESYSEKTFLIDGNIYI